MEQHPRSDADGSRRRRAAASAGRAGRASPPHDRDERANALVNNFAGQWLQLRNLEAKVAPDLLMFPDFDDNIRKAFRRETELFFGYILRENRSALELLSADYTFVNERLASTTASPASTYALPTGEADRPEPPRAARSGQRPVADVGGNADLAGLSRQVRPGDVPQHAAAAAAAERATLEEAAKGAKTAPKTVRETLELHRSSPVCASCHRIIDPPVSHSRTSTRWVSGGKDRNGAGIDAAGVLADGTKVNGPVALRNAILSRPEAFVTVLTERIMTYALGRGSNRPICRSCGASRKAGQNNYRLASSFRASSRAHHFRCGPGWSRKGPLIESRSLCLSEGQAAMIITKKHLSRRTFLRALWRRDGAAPARCHGARAHGTRKTAARTPFRFGAIYMPNGVYPDTWHPTTEGANFEFKPVMQPLEPFRDQLVTISKMKAPWGESVHLGASSAFLNGTGPVGSRDDSGDAFGKIQSKKTTDQYIADVVADDTPLRSIEVGTEDMGTAVGACDGFPCTFFNALSWRDDFSPLPIGINPRVTFERMFGETGSTEQRTARLKEKQSLLDSVMQETAKLRQLGAPDKAILDEYLSNIRQVEQQLDRMETRLGTITGTPEAPIGLPEAFDDHMTSPTT